MHTINICQMFTTILLAQAVNVQVDPTQLLIMSKYCIQLILGNLSAEHFKQVFSRLHTLIPKRTPWDNSGNVDHRQLLYIAYQPAQPSQDTVWKHWESPGRISSCMWRRKGTYFFTVDTQAYETQVMAQVFFWHLTAQVTCFCATRLRKQGLAWSCTSKLLSLLRYLPREKGRASFQSRSEDECYSLRDWYLWHPSPGIQDRGRTHTPHVTMSDQSFWQPACSLTSTVSTCWTVWTAMKSGKKSWLQALSTLNMWTCMLLPSRVARDFSCQTVIWNLI